MTATIGPCCFSLSAVEYPIPCQYLPCLSVNLHSLKLRFMFKFQLSIHSDVKSCRQNSISVIHLKIMFFVNLLGKWPVEEQHAIGVISFTLCCTLHYQEQSSDFSISRLPRLQNTSGFLTSIHPHPLLLYWPQGTPFPSTSATGCALLDYFTHP